MNKPMKHIRGVSAACLLAVPIMLSGCSLFGSESAAVDPPPGEVEAQMLQVSGEGTLDTGVLGPVSLDESDLAAGLKMRQSPLRLENGQPCTWRISTACWHRCLLPFRKGRAQQCWRTLLLR